MATYSRNTANWSHKRSSKEAKSNAKISIDMINDLIDRANAFKGHTHSMTDTAYVKYGNKSSKSSSSSTDTSSGPVTSMSLPTMSKVKKGQEISINSLKALHDTLVRAKKHKHTWSDNT